MDVEISFSCSALNRVFQVEFFRRAFTGEPPQPPQGDFYVPRAELDRVVEIAILALVPDLHRAAVARALLADAHALGVVAVGAERRGAGGADPFRAALMPAFLLLQPLLQGLHQLLPAAERFDLLLLFFTQRQLDLLEEPLERHLRLDSRDRLHALPELGEGAVELVEVRLV